MIRLATWLESTLQHERGYRFAVGCPVTLLATCCGVLALELMNELEALPDTRRRELGDLILSQQAKGGGFADPAHPRSVTNDLGKFAPLYVEWQQTYFALHALEALGRSEEAAPLAFMDPLRGRRFVTTWFEGLRWDDFWLSSNYLMFVLFFMLHEGAEASAHHLLDRLDACQDPDTGYWGTQQGSSLFNGMAGAFHLYGFYLFLDRPLAFQSRAIASTLALQEQSGLFGGIGGGPCEDVDAIDILTKLEPSSAAQDAEVRAALRRAVTALETCRTPDGGYRWHAPVPGSEPTTIRYSGLSTMTARSDAGDVWSAWFRPLGLALARARLGEPLSWTPRFRARPLLGWHPQT